MELKLHVWCSRVQLIETLKQLFLFSPSYFQPQSPKGTSKELQFWLFLLVTHNGAFWASSNDTASRKDPQQSSYFNEFISLGNSRRTPALHRRTGCIMTLAKRCCNTLSRATTSASLPMDRQEQANRILWWGSRRRDRKESFPWFVQWHMRSNKCPLPSLFHILVATANHLASLLLSSVKICLRRSMGRPTKKGSPTQLRWASCVILVVIVFGKVDMASAMLCYYILKELQSPKEILCFFWN